ncbi:hypothetical protein IQ244_19225 [Nostoc sp. LEGE 06077]|uniref:hypothetical protein n=1 Tax=Nostoc sp. LEGE 06077 TaxID=915325 RepID=UPI00187FA1C2|nr:hypothetical protein [Nostoc sp. LEGE 06077]MBE9208630.1 hypothetical protein [Nostoc sp. LEGE 06077]
MQWPGNAITLQDNVLKLHMAIALKIKLALLTSTRMECRGMVRSLNTIYLNLKLKLRVTLRLSLRPSALKIKQRQKLTPLRLTLS